MLSPGTHAAVWLILTRVRYVQLLARLDPYAMPVVDVARAEYIPRMLLCR